MWLMSSAEDGSQHCWWSEVNLAWDLRSPPQCGAPLCCPLYVSRREKTHWTSWILHESPAMTGWKGKQKGKISSAREGEEQREGWRRDKECPVRPNKDRLYSDEGQMGVLFMVSPYTRRGAPLGPLKQRRCMFIQFFPPGSHTYTWDNLWSPNIHTILLRHYTKVLDVCSVIFYSPELHIIPQVCSSSYAMLFPGRSHSVCCSAWDEDSSRCSVCSGLPALGGHSLAAQRLWLAESWQHVLEQSQHLDIFNSKAGNRRNPFLLFFSACATHLWNPAEHCGVGQQECEGQRCMEDTWPAVQGIEQCNMIERHKSYSSWVDFL